MKNANVRISLICALLLALAALAMADTCPKCGREILPRASVCPACGARLGAGEKPARTGRPWLRPGSRPGQEITGPDGGTMVWVPAGSFVMGSEANAPQHAVQITRGFWMGKHEVTNAQYRKFKPEHDCKDWKGVSLNGDSQPAINVSWNEAKAYCDRFGLALPTEAQWEYACRAGSTTVYWWGDNRADGAACMNVGDQAFTARLGGHTFWEFNDGQAVSAPVGSYRANAFGLCDMAGNVFEWCADRFGPYAAGAQQDPQGPDVGQYRVIRGGSWMSNTLLPVASAERSHADPFYRHMLYGFRVVKTP